MKTLRIHSQENGLHDQDTLLLHAAFQALVDYIEKEAPGEIIDWTTSKECRHAWKEIRYLYRWWTKTRPARKNPMEKPGLKKPRMRFR